MCIGMLWVVNNILWRFSFNNVFFVKDDYIVGDMIGCGKVVGDV